jgi:NodT family efflux transporter outer membrane factor (OMF) lipoprotein
MNSTRAVSIEARRMAVLGVALASVLGGCITRDPPTPEELQRDAMPNVQPPSAWVTPAAEGAVGDGWLAGLGDAQLEKLVEEALTHNSDLQVAAARVARATAAVRIAGGQLYPAANLLARAGGPLSGDGSGLEGALFSLSWELDLWGRVRYGHSAAGAQADAATSDYLYAAQSLAALVAKSWFLTTEALQQQRLAEETVASSAQLVELVQVRRRVGVANEQELALARADLAGFQATLEPVRRANPHPRRALVVVVGRYPSAELAVRETLVPVPPPAPAGVPGELLERRPDVIAAERRVASAFNRKQQAKAALLPRISLTGAFGTVTSELFVLQGDSDIASAGANLFAPIFEGGALRAQVKARSAEQREAMAHYAAVGLRAFNEVETALAAEHTLARRAAILTAGVQDNRRALELVRLQYQVGKASLFDVLQQQLRLYSANSALVRVNAERLAQRVNLYLALGSNFASPAPAPVAAVSAP